MLLLLRCAHTSTAARRLLTFHRGQRHAAALVPPKAMGSSADASSSAALATAKTALRKEMKARLANLSDEALAAECELRWREGRNRRAKAQRLPRPNDLASHHSIHSIRPLFQPPPSPPTSWPPPCGPPPLVSARM
jgi:hypothetical protein